MDDKKQKEPGSFRVRDFIVILLCLSAAAFSIYFFRLNLLETINSRDEQAAGTIIIMQNNAQRRTEGRLLWDRLGLGSPVHLGDLIRTAEHSALTIQIENDFIDLDANTLAHIRRIPRGTHPFYIELKQGNLSLISDAEGNGVMLSIEGRKIMAEAGTILNAAASGGGLALRVSEGRVLLAETGQEIDSGGMLVINAVGIDITSGVPAAVVTQPRPVARYLKDSPGGIVVNFAWNRLNLSANEAILMEIAHDRNFTQIVNTIDNLANSAIVPFDTGIWYWRLRGAGIVLSTGRLTVADSMGPQLLSPVTDSLFRFQGDYPRLRFQWAETPHASSYLVEVCRTPQFINPDISRETSAVFIVDSSLTARTWYWRVTPIFPPVYLGAASASPFASFDLEYGSPQGFVLPQVVPPELRLLSPAHGASLAGLTALRQPTEFSWEFDGELSWSRFVLSRSPNPLAGQPVVQILNPGRTVRVNSILEGNWYWTVEGETTTGIAVRAEQPKLLRVQPIPLLAEPANRLPVTGHIIGIPQLRVSREIDFRWSAVSGANAYIFTLQQDIGGRRQTIRTATVTGTNWRLDNINVLYPGNFFWRVEAVNRNAAGVIQQRGRVGENAFVLNVPAPGPVFLEDPGVLYGN